MWKRRPLGFMASEPYDVSGCNQRSLFKGSTCETRHNIHYVYVRCSLLIELLQEPNRVQTREMGEWVRWCPSLCNWRIQRRTKDMHREALGKVGRQDRIDKVHEEVQEDWGGGCWFYHEIPVSAKECDGEADESLMNSKSIKIRSKFMKRADSRIIKTRDGDILKSWARGNIGLEMGSF